MSSGGYDYEFVPELLHEFVCIICHLALRNPKKIETCGHQFCASCLNHMKNCANPRNEVTCPIDRQAFTAEQVFNDKGTERMILNWKVKCPNHENGCEWVGELSTVENHDKECTHTMELSIYEINKKFQKLESAIKQKSDELTSLKETVVRLESEVSDKTDKLSLVQNQLDEVSKELFSLKYKHSVKEENTTILDSEDPRTIHVISNKFEWSCPYFTDKEIDQNSPKYYYGKYCFRLSLFVDESGDLCVVLYRVRGKFDTCNVQIKDMLPDSFIFYVRLRNISLDIAELRFVRRSWKIGKSYDLSLGEVKTIGNPIDYVHDSFYHVECEFCKD